MKKYFIGLMALSLCITVSKAQDAPPKPPIKKEKREITINKNEDGKHEKMVIIIDGDNVTINGKPMGDLKGSMKMLGDMGFNFNDLPGNDMAMGPNMQKFHRFNFNNNETHNNKALLGVITEQNPSGAKVSEVSKESAAEKAGMQSGDIITQINNDKITSPESLVEAIGKLKPQDIANITVLRNGKEQNLKAQLGKNEQAANMDWNFDGPQNNMGFNAPQMPQVPNAPRMRNFDYNDNRPMQDDRPKFGFSIKDNENGDGAVITTIKDGSNAAKAGLKPNDIVTEANGNAIKTTDDLKAELRTTAGKTLIGLKVLRNGKTEDIKVNVPKRIKTADL